MPQRDGKNGIQPVHLGNVSLAGTTAASSAWMDTLEADMATLIIVNNTVTDAGAAAGYSFVLEESDTTAAADATTVDAAQTVGVAADLSVTADGADNAIAGWIGYVGSKRYVRVTGTGTTGSDADVSVIGIASALSTEPRSAAGTAVAAT